MTCTERLKLAVYAGEIMLSNGAETYRVEDTMERIINRDDTAMGETLVTTTGIFATIHDQRQGVVTIVKRIRKRTYHLGKVAQINNFSRQFAAQNIGWCEAMKTLEQIDCQKPYPLFLRILLSAVACFCFAGMFGGNLGACCAAFFVGLAQYSIVQLLIKHKVSEVPSVIIGGCVIATLTLILVNLLSPISIYYDKIIVGAIMPLVPGVGLTNAVRDILEGDYLSGACRILDAVLVAVCIAVGVGAVMSLWFFLFGGVAL